MKNKIYKGNITSWAQWIPLHEQGYNIVAGDFYCNGICRAIKVNMFAMPKKIIGNCDISSNELTSLVGTLNEVQGFLDFSYNEINLLAFMPIVKGDVMGTHCNIKGLNTLGFQRVFNGDVDLSNNQILKIFGLYKLIFKGQLLLNKNNFTTSIQLPERRQ